MEPERNWSDLFEDPLEIYREDFERHQREGPILAPRPDDERVLVLPFVIGDAAIHSVEIHRAFTSALREARFSGFCHCFDRSLSEISHYVAGIAFSEEADGEPCDLFEQIWPILLTHLALHPALKILPENCEMRRLGYVRRRMYPTGTVLFERGVPGVSLTGFSMFGKVCYEEFLRAGGSGTFFRDPLELWSFSLGPDLPPKVDDPEDPPF